MKYKIGDRFKPRDHFSKSGYDWTNSRMYDSNTIFIVTKTRFCEAYQYCLTYKRIDSGYEDSYSFVPATWIDSNFIYLKPDAIRELEGDYYK